jgi:two-component system, LytTR family, response regulator
MHNLFDKLILSKNDAYHFIDITDIVYCKSKNSCITFFMVNGNEITVSVSIRKVEELLMSRNFIRPHQSYLININHIKRICRTSESRIVLSNNISIPISTRRKKTIMHFIAQNTQIQILS